MPENGSGIRAQFLLLWGIDLESQQYMEPGPFECGFPLEEQ